MISYVYFKFQCFELRICLFYENSNLKMQLFCTSHKSLRSTCALGTSGLSEFINIKRLNIKLEKERQCHIIKQLMHSFLGNIRITQPSKVIIYLGFASVNITYLGLTNTDVNLKRMHQLYNLLDKYCK